MKFADAAWWEMVVDTIAALHVEGGMPLTPKTFGPMAFQARELGRDASALRLWLATQPHPAPVPVPPVPVPPAPAPVPVPPVPTSADAIDLAAAVITNGSPDVRGWPIGATLTELTLGPGGMAINFTRRNGARAWPFVIGKEGGEIQYTLWIGCRIGGRWFLSGAILCISRGPDDNYVPTGPVLDPGQLPRNWYYFAGDPLATYQPQPGEMVAWFVTAGEQRRADVHEIRERSNVVVLPFEAGGLR
jgi:hypothetical protein